jgi:superfamily II DNA or RNA helicase
MKKAVLSNRIYMNYTDELYEKIKTNLTYKIPAKIPGDPPEIRKTYEIIQDGAFITLPIGRKELIPPDYQIVDKRVYVPTKFPEFNFTLRESQRIVHDAIQDNCLINANVSWGKTFTAIAIARKLKQKTLVITHTVNLRDQWKREVEKTLKIKPGIIGSGQFDYKDKAITIANVQTLRKHILTLRKEFGTVILDEVHHCPAKIFSDCVDGMHSRFKIGLSATLRRKDYLHILIPDYFSPTVYKPKAENQMKPEVLIVKTDIPFSSNNMIPWANRVNELVERPEYLELVTRLAEDHANIGHKVLLVSDRTEFLEKCAYKCGDRAALIIGSTKDRDELHNELRNDMRDILCGALSIYKEGISEEYLSCLVLGAPINNDPLLEQLIGRIKRKYPNKMTPLVIDIVLKGATARKQAAARAGHYMRNGYKVTLLDLT